MSTPGCPRLWQVEAVENGHLAGADRASFERHAATCAECSCEIEALASLGERMRQVTAADPPALAMRRMRAAVLEGSHARRTRARPAHRARAVMAALAAVLVLVVAGWLSGGLRSSRVVARTPTEPPPAAAPGFDVVDVSGAIVTSRTEGQTTRALLGDGIAAFHVERVAPGLRFIVSLPDGEIEVRGTRFVVAVRDGRTRDVEVDEGVVVLRLRGQDERRLEAGQKWSLPAPLAAVLAPRVPASAPSDVPPLRPGKATPFTGPSAEPPASSQDVAPPATPTAARVAANDRFARAVAAFQAGRYAEAEPLFGSFAREFPGDARTEDASFLRAVARSRSGDAAGAASLARAYLQTFPRGLRRREAEDLIRQAP